MLLLQVHGLCALCSWKYTGVWQIKKKLLKKKETIQNISNSHTSDLKNRALWWSHTSFIKDTMSNQCNSLFFLVDFILSSNTKQINKIYHMTWSASSAYTLFAGNNISQPSCKNIFQRSIRAFGWTLNVHFFSWINVQFDIQR